MRYRPSRSPDLDPLWYLLGINVLLYFVSLAVPGVIDRYGLVPADVLSRPWLLVTAMFLHANWVHIVSNMLTLYFFGRYVIELQGSTFFLVVYFIGGLIGNIAYALLAPSYSIAIGASGAIFALGGALVALVPKARVIIFPVPLPMPLWIAVVGGFLLVSFVPGVAWQAHTGGIITGIIAGLYARRRLRRVR